MTADTTVLAIPGSLRHDSVNRRLLRAAATLAPAGVRVEAWDGLKDVPPFDEDDEAAPGPAVGELRRAIEGADAVLLVTPEYNGSLPGQLKNALDWVSRPFGSAALTDKPVAMIGASPSPAGTAGAQEHLRTVLGRIGARVVTTGLVVPHAYERLTDDETVTDGRLRAGVAAVFTDLVDTAARTTCAFA